MPRIVTDKQLNEWLNLAQLVVDHDYANFMPDRTDWTPELEIDSITSRTKYARIFERNKSSGQRGVWCFINLETGDVLKADGWKKPALNFARGNIFEADHGLSGAKWTSVS